MSDERRMLLRSRIALATACAFAVAIAAVSVLTWFATRHNLRTQLDESLLASLPPAVRPPPPQARAPEFGLLCAASIADEDLQRFLQGVQLLKTDGTTCAPVGVDQVVTDERDRAVRVNTLRDGRSRAGTQVRVLLHPLPNGDVLAISRGLTEIDDTLTTLANVLVAVSVLGAALVAGAGQLLTRRALAPMEHLTETAEHIARTENLATPITVSGHDEVGRLGRAFTAMTAALAESRRRQRDLVNDAAHELRTPLTSLRTNIDLLARSERTGRPLPDDERALVLDRLQAQSREFGDLVTELVVLARDDRELARGPVAVDEVIDRAVRRVRSRTKKHVFLVDHEPWTTLGDTGALERSVLNLLDNAVKFSPAHSTIVVWSRPGRLTVTDEGPGLPEEHRQHAFERFWRAPDARALPGSGLGLAIVADTVTAHGGSVRFTSPRSGHGATVDVELPTHDSATPGTPRARAERRRV